MRTPITKKRPLVPRSSFVEAELEQNGVWLRETRDERSRSRTMKRIPRRAYGGKIDPNKLVASFCFLNSPYCRFAEAFVDLLGVLSRSTRVSVHVPANCQLSSVARLDNHALFHMGNKASVLLVARDFTI